MVSPDCAIYLHGGGVNARLYGKIGLYGSLLASDGKQFIGGANEGKAVVLSADPQVYIREIVFHPDMDYEDRLRIQGIIVGSGLGSKIRT